MKKILLTVAIVFMATLINLAQTPLPPNGGDLPDEGNTPVGGGAPVGSGLGILIILGAAYTYKKTMVNHHDDIILS